MPRLRAFLRTSICLLAGASLSGLAGCGALPQPFAGNPGRLGRHLVQPPPARLVVEPAATALLPDAGMYQFANALADALVDREVPAVPAFGRKGEWRLVTSAELQGGRVVPHYAVHDPDGVAKGTLDGAPVDAGEWSAADPATLKHEAALAAPGLVALLDRIEAKREQSDPNSLLNRPTRVAIKSVTGAPGDGNASLALELGRELAKMDEVVVPRPETADFVVIGQVAAVPIGPGSSRIELQWTVLDAQGRENGKIVQLNDVPSAAVSGLWGQTAVAAATEAASGVKEVILRRLEGRRDGGKPTS